MKSFIIFSLILLNSLFVISHSSLAESYLRDVPEGHYAYDAVYDLINRGVIGGYPDGTFRGKNQMTRYEIAAFISKLYQSLGRQKGKQEKIVSELRTEAAQLQVGGPMTAGNLEMRWRRGDAGVVADYRVKASYFNDFPGDSSLKIGLDTMDSGFNGTARDLTREMLELEGKTKIGNTVIKVTAGPGDLLHTDNVFFPAENKMFYRRPRRTIGFNSNLGMTDLAVEYLARSNTPSGLVQVAELSGKLVGHYAPVKLTLNPRIFTNNSGDRDIRLDLAAEYNELASLTLGIAKTTAYPSGLYVRGDVALGDSVHLLVQKVGSQYREDFTYPLFDIFDRDVPDGSTSIGLEAKENFMDSWYIRAKGDVTNPGNVLTTEFHLGKNINENIWLEAMTQGYQSSLAYGLAAGIAF
ncbi:MAG: S-layer homology domain-containing protein [bacterium]